MKKQVIEVKKQLKKTEKFSYSMQEAAHILGLKDNKTLYSFLRHYNIVQGTTPSHEFSDCGYFEVCGKNIENRNGEVFRITKFLRVTKEGVLFINDLYNILTKGLYAKYPFYQ